jgi:hypothetical protein
MMCPVFHFKNLIHKNKLELNIRFTQRLHFIGYNKTSCTKLSGTGCFIQHYTTKGDMASETTKILFFM